MLAAVGLVIYEFFAGTPLENYAAVAATWLALFVITAVTRRPARYLMWVCAGSLVFTLGQVISTLADERLRPVHHHLIRLGGRFIFAGGVACVVAGVVIWIRSGELPLLRIAQDDRRPSEGLRQRAARLSVAASRRASRALGQA